ncbi:MarR family winged helix-turn-helix transcriptional regulator [Sphingoaurantiacus capsulatus]|uniref:MarR family winged helix-turn-helix transcriptional regulator n=1 Tax=Sphingoaurantiacus capsulatus TaxID=1771310 RepID=A0ABV7X482_9SPHN
MTDPAALTAHLGYWLRAVSNQVSHAFALKLEGEGVTVAEWVVLRELYGQPPANPSRLAERLALTRGAISKLAERLIDKGLLARTESDADRRAHTLALTRAGAAKVPALAALADANEAQFFGGLGAADHAALDRILKTLADRHGLQSPPMS